MKSQTETDRMGWVLSRKHVKFDRLSNKIMENYIFPTFRTIFCHLRVLSLIEIPPRIQVSSKSFCGWSQILPIFHLESKCLECYGQTGFCQIHYQAPRKTIKQTNSGFDQNHPGQAEKQSRMSEYNAKPSFLLVNLGFSGWRELSRHFDSRWKI